MPSMFVEELCKMLRRASVLTPKIYLLLYSKYILQLLHQLLFVSVSQICSMTCLYSTRNILILRLARSA